MKAAYKHNPIAIALTSILTMNSLVAFAAETIIDPKFDPTRNDHEIGKLIIGENQNITLKNRGNSTQDSFERGKNGVIDGTSLREMLEGNQIDDEGKEVLESERIEIGYRNHSTRIKDPITGTDRTFMTFNSNNIQASRDILDTPMIDIERVDGKQYINTRIADVNNGGTLSINLGDSTRQSHDEINKLNMAVKDSSLFMVNEGGTLNWDSHNLIGLNAATAYADGKNSFTVTNIAKYGGEFTFEAPNGKTFTKNVNSMEELKAFNDWLIEGIQSELLVDPRSPNAGIDLYQSFYDETFAKAFKYNDQSIYYNQKAGDYDPNSPDNPDEIFLDQGVREVIHATGKNAQVTINGLLETSVTDLDHATTKITDHASITISEKGVLGARYSPALQLETDAKGTNQGIINSGFHISKNDDDIIHPNTIDDMHYPTVTVGAKEGASFNNEGVINILAKANGYEAVVTGMDLAHAVEGGGICGDGFTGCNSGSINIGVANAADKNLVTGVHVHNDASFINQQEGEIYLGRELQNKKDDIVAETTLNQSIIASGIKVTHSGNAINEGKITIGTQTQNAAAMIAADGPEIKLINRGTLLVNGNPDSANAPNMAPNMTYGMLVRNSGTEGNIRHEGIIELNGVNGTGILAHTNHYRDNLGDDKIGNTHIQTSKESLITIDGSAEPSNGTRNYGVWVAGHEGGHATADLNGKIILKGDGAIGVHARGKADVNVNQGAIPDMIEGEEQIAFFAYGPNARIAIQDANDFEVATNRSTLFRVEDGAILDEKGLTLTTSGTESVGILATGDKAGIYLNNSKLLLEGDASHGIMVEGGANGTLDKNTRFIQKGEDSIAVTIDGVKHDLSGHETEFGLGVHTTVISDAELISADSADGKLMGYRLKDGADLIHNGTINYTQGEDNHALWLSAREESTNTLKNNGTIHVNHGTGMLVEGEGTNKVRLGTLSVDEGIAGVHLRDGAQLEMFEENIIKIAGTADGILVDQGATKLSTESSEIILTGNGNGIENRADISDITLKETTITIQDGAGIRTTTSLNDASEAIIINVDGAGTGFAFTTNMGESSQEDLNLSEEYTINVTGEKGVGIHANTSGVVTLSANVNIDHELGGSALIIGDKTQNVAHSGKLQSISTTAAVVDLSHGTNVIFENSGTIHAKDHTQMAVFAGNNVNQLHFIDGDVRGEIEMNRLDGQFNMENTAFEGGITLKGADSIATITNVDLGKTSHIITTDTGNSHLTLNNISVTGASFDQTSFSIAEKGTNFGDYWNQVSLDNNSQLTLSDSLTLAGDNAQLNINEQTALFAGNNINPTIFANRVNNSGKIDLTNDKKNSVGNQLTIAGDYYGTGDIYLNTTFNAGGDLKNQMTDRLLIEGNATGETTLHVNSTQLSDGSGTDRNRNGKVDSDEGISVVQVGGTSASNTFKLAHEYVTSGAFQYQLYSFAPDQSDAKGNLVGGDQYWDYRLANTIVTRLPDPSDFGPPTTPDLVGPDPINPTPINPINPNKPTTPIIPSNQRKKVTPQVPNYISAPMALEIYNHLVMDDMHKRLGDLRRGSAITADNQGQVYARMIGSRMKYKSNQSFENYGYHFDFDLYAIQLGGNLFHFDTNQSLFSGGVAWTHGESTLKPNALDGYSKTKFNSDTFGLYATWENEHNVYFDGVLAYTHHRGKVNTDQGQMNTLKANTWSASIEAGYGFELENNWVIEPQVQLSYTSIKFKDSIDRDQAKVSYDRYNQTTLRLGVRGSKSWLGANSTTNTVYGRLNYYQPFGSAANINIANAGIANSEGYNFTGGKQGRSIQAGIGGTTTFDNNLSIYGEIDYQKNLSSYGQKGWRGNIGIKWNF